MFKIFIFAAILSVACAAVAAPQISVRATENYYFSTTQVTFPQAWAYCKNADLEFLSITTSAQNTSLATALGNLGVGSNTFWLGGIYLKNGFVDKWFWVDEVEDVNWNLPTFASTLDYCIYYNYTGSTKSGTLDYGLCDGQRYFICQ